MIITVEQLKTIVAAGGGLSLDASAFTFNQLREIVAVAPTKKASVSLKNVSGFTADQLVQLASLAPGLVSFDLDTDATS